MAGVPRSSDFAARILQLERAVSVLQKQSTLTSASIGEGNLTIRHGGSLIVTDGGSIIGEGTGTLDWEGNAHFGGNLVVDGNTTLGGNLTFGDNTVPPEALARRVEAATFAGSNSGTSNQQDLNVTVSVPSWVQTTSCVAMGTAYAQAPDGTRISAVVTIDGTTGATTSGAAYAGANTIPANSSRTFAPAGGSTFVVNLHTGAAPTSAAPLWELTLAILCVFVKTS